MMLLHRKKNAAARGARRLLVAAILAAGLAQFAVQAQAQTFVPRDENPEDYPAGAGREETFYGCTACHGFKIIAAQGQNRRQWNDTINWMTEKHGMPAIEGKDRETILDYLEATFPPRAPAGRGGFQNPFAPR